jgi:hypothetical protein
MKATFRVLAVMVGAASLVSANSFTLNNVTDGAGTFLSTQTFGTPSNPTLPTGVTVPPTYTLSQLDTFLGLGPGALTPGSTMSFTAIGEVCYSPGGQGCTGASTTGERSVSSSFFTYPPIEGVFLNCSGAGFTCAAPGGSATANLSPGGFNQWTANITGMFNITSLGTTIIIPTGATSVEFSFVDSYYADNSDFSGTLGVQMGAAAGSVPEPATYGMMIAGLGALLAFKRLRRS